MLLSKIELEVGGLELLFLCSILSLDVGLVFYAARYREGNAGLFFWHFLVKALHVSLIVSWQSLKNSDKNVSGFEVHFLLSEHLMVDVSP